MPRPRGRFGKGPRPTDEQYRQALQEYAKHQAGLASVRATIAPMIAIGGYEWIGDAGGRRIYFTPNSLRGNAADRYISGYYDVPTRRFVSSSQSMTDNEFAIEIIEAMRKGGVEEAAPAQTLDAVGTEILPGAHCIIVGRDVPGRPDWIIDGIMGKAVIAARRYAAAGEHSLYPLAWFVEPATGEFLQVLSRNFEAEMHTLLLNASSLLVISGGTGEEAAPTDADQLDTVR